MKLILCYSLSLHMLSFQFTYVIHYIHFEKIYILHLIFPSSMSQTQYDYYFSNIISVMFITCLYTNAYYLTVVEKTLLNYTIMMVHF